MLEEKKCCRKINLGGKQMLEEKKCWRKKMLKEKILEEKIAGGKKSALPLTSPPRKLQGWVEGQCFYV